MVQMPKETFLSHPPQDAANLESLIPSAEREPAAFPTNHERMTENLPFSQRSSEIFQRPLWNMNRELGLLPFSQQPVLESPELTERDPNCSSPVTCRRLHDHAFDFSRTRIIQDGTEGTWSPLRRKSEQRLKLVIYYLRIEKKSQYLYFSLLQVTSDHISVALVFGLTPGKEKVVADRSVPQKCVPRWKCTALAEDNMGRCPSWSPPGCAQACTACHEESLLLSLLDCSSPQNGPEKASLLWYPTLLGKAQGRDIFWAFLSITRILQWCWAEKSCWGFDIQGL